MASSCAKLCLRCSTVASSMGCLNPTSHVSAVSRMQIKFLHGSTRFIRNHRTAQERIKWNQQFLCHSNYVSKNLTEAKENRNLTELQGPDLASIPSLSLRDSVTGAVSKMRLDLDAPAELSALEDIGDEEAVSISVSTTLPPDSTSLRDYVDQSETLSKLVQLGVNLWKLEQRPNVGSMLLRLNFDTDVAPRLLFLKDIGVEESRFAYIITHNPFILTVDMENLQARVNYLKSKNFGSETVASMVSRAPYLLNFSVKRLDNRLGFFQQQLNLSATNTRAVVARLPRLLCGSLEPVKENLKVCEIELGFKINEIQQIVLAVPKVLTANKRKLTQIFDFLHNTMKVPHHLIVKFPQVLNTKFLRIRDRHLFLKYLGRAQYDPDLPNYLALDLLVSLPDESFCTDLALATLEDFCLFQKTL